jgi:hypothetical protein
MKKLLIISFSNIYSDPRVMRQVRLLESLYALTVVGSGKKPDARIKFIELQIYESFLLKLLRALMRVIGLFETQYWMQTHVKQALQILNNEKFDLVLANDVSALPLAFKLNADAPVLCDAHEYSPREFDEKFLWRLHNGSYTNYLCATYLKKCNAMTTVCKGIADEYLKHYGVNAKVVHSAPSYQALLPQPLINGKIKLIHHGASIRARHLETMIKMMDHVDERFTLDFMLMETDAAYLAELKLLAAPNPRISFIPAVPMENICKFINQYDVGVYLLPPVNFNHQHALPNKFFEFVQASLAVAIGPSPEMANLLNQYHLGIVARSFEPTTLAKSLNQFTNDDILKYKQAAFVAAKSLNAENEGKVLLDEIESLFKVC